MAITEKEVKNKWAERLKIEQEKKKAAKEAVDAHKAAGLLKIKNDKVAENPTASPYSENWRYKGDDIEQQWKDTGGWGFGKEDNGQGFFTPLPLVSTPQDHPRYPNSPFYNTPNELKGVSPWIKDELQIRKGKEIFKLNTGIPLAHHTGGGPGLEGFQEPQSIEAILESIILNETLSDEEKASTIERITGQDPQEVINQFKLRQQQKQSLKIGKPSIA